MTRLSPKKITGVVHPTLDQIVGHVDLLDNFRNVIAHRQPGHAHLFFGPPGVGKSTVASAFVQALFCQAVPSSSEEKRREGVPSRPTGCGRCPACQKVAQNNHGDFVRVEVAEGKTRIGIDQIRDLAGFFSLTPMESDWKVATIDDAATMNEASANALLKTLEEPPAHSILILITCRFGRLLPTIRSRCMKTRFSPLSKSELRRVFTHIISLDEDTVTEVLEIGGGDIGRMLAFTQGELPELRKEFRKEMTSLSSMTLAQLSLLAERWSSPQTFPLIVLLLRAWFQESLHASVLLGSQRPGDNASQEGWLKTIFWGEQLLQQAAVINLNRRLVLEAVFIRMARLQGALC